MAGAKMSCHLYDPQYCTLRHVVHTGGNMVLPEPSHEEPWLEKRFYIQLVLESP